MKEQIHLIRGLALLAGLAGSALGQTTGVPEPGVIVYGKVLASDGITTLPPTVLTVVTRFAPQSSPLNTVLIPTTVGRGADGMTYFVARINFGNEAAVPGSDNQTAGSKIHFDYPSQPTTYGLNNSQSGVNSGIRNTGVSVPTPYSPSFVFPASAGGENVRGQMVRMDLLTTLGAPDGSYESWAGLYFSQGTSQFARTADPDHDGLTNEAEWAFKTDPTNTHSNRDLHRLILIISAVPGHADQKELTFKPKWDDRYYRITKTTDLGQASSFAVDPDISPITNGPPLVEGAVEAEATDLAAIEPKAFYRVEVSVSGTFPPTKTPYESWAAQYFAQGTPESEQTADPDRDGLTNEAEWVFKTDPTNTNANVELHRLVVVITPVVGQPQQKELTFKPKWSDRFYRVTKSTDLGVDNPFAPDPDITPVVDGESIGGGAVKASVKDMTATERAAFYRVEASINGNFPPP